MIIVTLRLRPVHFSEPSPIDFRLRAFAQSCSEIHDLDLVKYPPLASLFRIRRITNSPQFQSTYTSSSWTFNRFAKPISRVNALFQNPIRASRSPPSDARAHYVYNLALAAARKGPYVCQPRDYNPSNPSARSAAFLGKV